MIFILVENLIPDIKKQIEDNYIIQVATQFCKELKTTVLVLQMDSLQKEKCGSRNNSKLTYYFYQPQNLASSSPKFCRYWKYLNLGEKILLGGPCILSLCLLRCKYSTWSSLGMKVILIRRRKKNAFLKTRLTKKSLKFLPQILVKIFNHLPSKQVILFHLPKPQFGCKCFYINWWVLHYLNCLMVKILK